MAKRFNVTGSCFRKDHYMADVSDKFAAVKNMIEMGDYFIINRPRQYGKTTTLQNMVSAFAGKERVFAAYAHAVSERYRFFSYGDAMLLWPVPL